MLKTPPHLTTNSSLPPPPPDQTFPLSVYITMIFPSPNLFICHLFKSGVGGVPLFPFRNPLSSGISLYPSLSLYCFRSREIFILIVRRFTPSRDLLLLLSTIKVVFVTPIQNESSLRKCLYLSFYVESYYD